MHAYPHGCTQQWLRLATLRPRLELPSQQAARRVPAQQLTGRLQVTEYVRERIAALRRQHPGQYTNISCLRTNAQKYLPYYFHKGQLQKVFFLFPVRYSPVPRVARWPARGRPRLRGAAAPQDPHFKKANHRRRIVSHALLSEYAFCLAGGGVIYTITDVKEARARPAGCASRASARRGQPSCGAPQVGVWMRDRLAAHPCFEPLSDEELAADPAVALLTQATEEGQKVARNQGEVGCVCAGVVRAPRCD